MTFYICGGCPGWAWEANGPGDVYGPERHPLTLGSLGSHEWEPMTVTDSDRENYALHGRAASFDFIYPREDDEPNVLRVGLEDVRVANDLIIRYDFDRDGWAIESPTVFSWPIDDEVLDEGIEEVAFLPAFSEKADANLRRWDEIGSREGSRNP